MQLSFLLFNVLVLAGTAQVHILDEPDLMDLLKVGANRTVNDLSAKASVDARSQEVNVAACQGRLCGEKRIIVVRINSLDGNSDYCKADCAWKSMFGRDYQNGIRSTLDAATREASYGQMWFNQSRSTVVTVSVPDQEFTGEHCNFVELGARARELVKQQTGTNPDSYDFVYHFLPNNMRCPFGGVAFLQHKYAFSSPQYSNNAVVQHEVGHNYGLAHMSSLAGSLGTPGNKDGWDVGSSMGGGSLYSAADRYMLGWINGDAVQDLGEFARKENEEDLGNPMLVSYWDKGDCGVLGNDHNLRLCGGLSGSLCTGSNDILNVDTSVCQSGQARRAVLHQNWKKHGCEYFWYAQYVCTGPTTTTTITTTTIPEGTNDVLLTLASASRHSLNTTFGKHAVVFSLGRDAVFSLTYRTPHGTDGVIVENARGTYGWVLDHKVALHRLKSGRRVGQGALESELFAALSNGQSFTHDKGPVAYRGDFHVEICSADENQAVVSLTLHDESKRRSKCPSGPTTTTTTTTLSTIGAVSIQNMGSTMCLQSGRVGDVLSEGNSDCAQFVNRHGQFFFVDRRSSKLTNLCLEWFHGDEPGAGWGLWYCNNGHHGQKLVSSGCGKWCNNGKCIIVSGEDCTTTTTVSTTTTTTEPNIPGLTREEAAVYNPELASYWDLDHCGKASDDHHWSWCGKWTNECEPSVVVGQQVCASGVAVLNFTKQFAEVDGCKFAYFAQYVCEPTTTTTTTSTTSTTTTTTSTTTSRRVEGLTPEEAALYNPDLSSYWDLEDCGEASDNHNLQWCSPGPDDCHTLVAVEESVCASREAELKFTKRFQKLDQCAFAFYAQYGCVQSSSTKPDGRRLRGVAPSLAHYNSPMWSFILDLMSFFGFSP